MTDITTRGAAPTHDADAAHDPATHGASTFVPVTDRKRTGDRGQGGHPPGGGGPHAWRADADTNASARSSMVARVRAVTQSVQSRRAVATPEEAAAPAITDGGLGVDGRRGLWAGGPASPADVLAYTRSGAWMRGQQHWLVERLGQLWGLLALTVTVACAVLAWTVQRFTRFAVVAAVATLLWGAWFVDGGADTPPDPPTPTVSGSEVPR